MGGLTADNSFYLANAAAQGDPIVMLPYQISAVPAGSYSVSITAQGSGEDSYTNMPGATVTVPNASSCQADFTLRPRIALTPVSPVGYLRISSPPTFHWTIPAGYENLNLTLSVIDRCGKLV